MKFRCPGCGRYLNADEGTAGRKAKCPSCKTVIIVPHLTPEPPPESIKLSEIMGDQKEKK